MKSANPYLIFNGNCEEAFNFYKSVFGGEFTYIGRFKDMPGDQTLSESAGNRIMHITLPIGEHTSLMGSDSNEGGQNDVKFGDNIWLSISVESKEEADRVYNALAAGGKSIMPMETQFWGSYFGMVGDQFGINWMVSFENRPV